MERDHLICCLVGKFTTEDHEISAADLRIKIDNHLIDCNFTPIDTAHDLELLEELCDEIAMSVISSGKNRKTRRSN